MNSLTSALQESLDVYELIKQQLYFSIPTSLRADEIKLWLTLIRV